jgi:hypothetical protein
MSTPEIDLRSDLDGSAVADRLLTLENTIRDLCQAGAHVEPYVLWEKKNRLLLRHESQHPSLIAQLRESAYDRSGVARADGSASPSVPRLDIDAIDRMQAILSSVAGWCATFGVLSRSQEYARSLTQHATTLIAFPYGPPSEVVKAAALLTECATRTQYYVEWDLPPLAYAALERGRSASDAQEFAYQMERFRTWCRVFGGWDTPAWRPHVACPECEATQGKRAGMRVRLDVSSAVCLSCNATWDHSSIYQLATQVQAIGVRLRVPAPSVGLTQNRGA